MKTLLFATLALAFGSVAAPALADCYGGNVSAETTAPAPIVTTAGPATTTEG